VKVVDANVLLYAVNSEAPHHERAIGWLEGCFARDVVVGFSWVSALAFVRLSTKVNVFERALTIDEAFDQLGAWLEQPSSVVLEPSVRHADIMRELLLAVGSAGNLVNDAHLAALAIEHRGQVVSYDHDFSRFPGVTWEQPA
jgi:toxin-antitoxin system PIN domain toxin